MVRDSDDGFALKYYYLHNPKKQLSDKFWEFYGANKFALKQIGFHMRKNASGIYCCALWDDSANLLKLTPMEMNHLHEQLVMYLEATGLGD